MKNRLQPKLLTPYMYTRNILLLARNAGRAFDKTFSAFKACGAHTAFLTGDNITRKSISRSVLDITAGGQPSTIFVLAPGKSHNGEYVHYLNGSDEMPSGDLFSTIAEGCMRRNPVDVFLASPRGGDAAKEAAVLPPGSSLFAFGYPGEAHSITKSDIEDLAHRLEILAPDLRAEGKPGLSGQKLQDIFLCNSSKNCARPIIATSGEKGIQDLALQEFEWVGRRSNPPQWNRIARSNRLSLR